MKSKEILDANPKAASLIHDYYLNKMLDALEDDKLPENFKDFAREKGLPFENIVAMLEVNPRQLLDFFDDEDIYINVTRYVASIDNKAHCILDHNSTVKSKNVFDTRKEAELEGVKLAIEMLEKKLNSLEETNEDS
jgi:hypothetical protein